MGKLARVELRFLPSGEEGEAADRRFARLLSELERYRKEDEARGIVYAVDTATGRGHTTKHETRN